MTKDDTAPKSKLKIPKTPGKCVDLLYEKKQLARALAKPLEAVEADVKTLEAHIIETFPANDAEGVIGQDAKVIINRLDVATVKDWHQLFTYIVAEGLKAHFDGSHRAPINAKECLAVAAEMVDRMPFDLVQRRVSSPAVLARLANGIVVDGTEKIFVKKVSCTKR